MSPIICIIILINIIHKSNKLSMKNEIRSKCNESNTKTIVVLFRVIVSLNLRITHYQHMRYLLYHVLILISSLL